MHIRKAVFPAAGFGTRFLPVTKAQPKEMLPIVDKPVIQYLVEEAVEAGIKEIILVTGRGKRAIEDHFDYSYELENTLVERGKHGLLKEVQKISNMAKFAYVRQQMPLGDGHAILCAKELIGNEPFAVLFGDDLVDSKVPAIKQLIQIFQKVKAPVIALEKIPRKEVSRYGIVGVKKMRGTFSPRLFQITDFVEKPTPKEAPSNFAVIGKYILLPEVLTVLENATPSRDHEKRLADGLRKWLKMKKPLYGYEIEGKRYDTGDKLGFLMATFDFALKRKDLGPTLKKYLKKS